MTVEWAKGLQWYCLASVLHTFTNTEFFRLQCILMLLQNIWMLSLYFTLHLSQKALFNIWHSSAHPSWPYSSHILIAPGKGRQACGTFHSLCLDILPGRTWPGTFCQLVGCFWKQEDDFRLPVTWQLCLHKLWGFFYTFEPMIFTTIIH